MLLSVELKVGVAAFDLLAVLLPAPFPLPRVESEMEGGRSGRVRLLVLLLLVVLVPFSLSSVEFPTTSAPRMSVEPSSPIEVSSTMCSPLALTNSRIVVRTSLVVLPVRVESLSREVEEWLGRVV